MENFLIAELFEPIILSIKKSNFRLFETFIHYRINIFDSWQIPWNLICFHHVETRLQLGFPCMHIFDVNSSIVRHSLTLIVDLEMEYIQLAYTYLLEIERGPRSQMQNQQIVVKIENLALKL